MNLKPDNLLTDKYTLQDTKAHQHKKFYLLLARSLQPRYWLIALIVVYQKTLSPLLGPRCKYYPSCSSYARQSLLIHGFWSGSALSVWRLLRCNPFSDGGFDPVKSPSSSNTPRPR